VNLFGVDPTILQEIRYAGEHNFVGRPIAGYVESVCLLTHQAAYALKQAQTRALSKGYSLKTYDCFRPQRAVEDFAAWAKDLNDQRMKTEFYPNTDKSELFQRGYISTPSIHSRGSTVDLTLVRVSPSLQPYTFLFEQL
jgi:D-alanyl-D-alanine dipeptidase